MQGERWEKAKEVFFAALERDAAQREAFLASACGADAPLREEVLSLLDAHDRSGAFIAVPAAARTLPEATGEGGHAWIGRRLGGYRVVELLGAGGMSEVYRAVRDDDEFHKEVAVKVLRSGYDTETLLARFSIERQILATLDHPNIARLLDAGSTEEKLPYIVMDYIKGQPIDEYCTQERLSLRQRLELFRTLCDAVRYVHRHLMVHGDIKCSNILVTADGTLKLLDFGIAQLLNPLPGLPADPKSTALIALTPEYASPEQLCGAPITTASDVYSLGVLLYRLLVGKSPYRMDDGLATTLSWRIREQEPLLPSEAARLAGASVYGGSWRDLVGDIDCIVKLALRKEPTQRYASVEQLSLDVANHLDGHPVVARGGGPGYHLAKLVRRHRASAAIAALLAASLVGGIVATVRQARIADEERWRAERHFQSVRKLADTFMFDVHGAIETLPGSTAARQMLVDTSLAYLRTLAAEAGGDRALQRDLASAYEKVADVQGGFRAANLGDYDGAMRSYREALKIRTGLADSDPADREVRRELVRNHGKLSELASSMGDERAAIAHAGTVVKLADGLAAADDAAFEDRRNVATSRLSFGWLLAKGQDLERGIALMSESADQYQALLAENAKDEAVLRNLSLAHARIGEVLLDADQRPADALKHYESAYQIVRSMPRPPAQNTRLLKIEAFNLLGVAEALARLGSTPAALEKQFEAARMLRAMFDADPKNETARYDAAYSLGEAGGSLLALGRLAQAEEHSREAIRILEGSDAATGSVLGPSKVRLALEYFRAGQASALRAAAAGVSRAEKSRLCAQAQQAFARSLPVLADADRDERWKGDFTTRAQEAQSNLAVCAPILAAGTQS